MDHNHFTWRQRAAEMQMEAVTARLHASDALRVARVYRLLALGGWVVAVAALLVLGGAQ